jgi:hypothetical protein
MTRPLPRRGGFWRGYLSPAGTEIGRKLGIDEAGSPVEDHRWIVRYKAGGGVKWFYDAGATQFPVRRLDLDLNGIWRYLAVEELRFNTETDKLDRTTTGGRGYLQVDLKVFLAETSSGRYGFKASNSRGTLPPVFAPVRSFQAGFVIESID